jgi:hypothetical protein
MCTWSTQTNSAMDALRADVIDKTLRTNAFTKRIYCGTFPCDKLSSFKIPSHACGVIVNFDPSNKPGSHWIALYFDRNKNVEYFDTYARNIKTNIDIYNFIRSRGNKHVKFLTGDSIQHDDSSVCGHYSILFFLCRSKGISFQHFVNTFKDQTNSGDYDTTVKRIVNELIKVSLNKREVRKVRGATCFCNPEQCCTVKHECTKKISQPG